MLKTSLSAREALHRRYIGRIETNPDLDRSLVSFQANKTEPFYRWFKYKEGFSSALVRYCIGKVAETPGVLLDPFAGAGAALFAARDLGWDTIGIELLPVGFYAINARRSVEKVDPKCFAAAVERIPSLDLDNHYARDYEFRHIPITKGAFPAKSQKHMAAYLNYCDMELKDPAVRNLFKFACFCILEEISYTRKDGQYLRWDYRGHRDRARTKFDKGRVPPFGEAILRKLRRMASDLAEMNTLFRKSRPKRGALDVRKGSCLDQLPDMPSSSVDLVLTSPPYCNRYDYTRTYALELVHLGCDKDEVSRLRQRMLSCTVENKAKVEELRSFYGDRDNLAQFERVQKVFGQVEALSEVLESLEDYNLAGTLNNSNIPRMVRNYFYEMCFVVGELARILRTGGKILMVNDNVRYAGERIPVDLILSEFAAAFGLKVERIWTLPRGKGNSSQQMGNHGRSELRKCIYVWEKRQLP